MSVRARSSPLGDPASRSLVRGHRCVVFVAVTVRQLLQSLRRVLIVGVLIPLVGQDLVVPVLVVRIILAGQELVRRHVCYTKALGFSRSVCRFEAWPLVAKVGELAEDDQACAAGVAAGLVLDANDISGPESHEESGCCVYSS